MKVGFIKRYPNVLLVVQGQDESKIWFHGLNDVWPVEDFTEVEIHPCLFDAKHKGDLTEDAILNLFRVK